MKIYLDVTDTLAKALRTGIQRVVRKIAARAVAKFRQGDYSATPVITIGSRFFAIENFPDESPVTEQSSVHRLTYEVAKRRLFKVTRKIIKPIPIMGDVATWVAHRYRLLPFQRSLFDPVSGQQINFKPVMPGEGDVLVLLDSVWSAGGVLAAAEAAHSRGARVVSVVYDLIPLTHPQYCDKSHISAFSASLNRVLNMADAAISISADMADRVRQYASSRHKNQSNTLPVSHFYLGSDFSAPRPFNPGGNNDRWPKGLWDDNPVFIMLGTIEPRKGHAFVLDAFQQRWMLGKKDKLLIVGETDDKSVNVRKRILSSPHYGRNMFLINNADDALVVEALRRSHACIFASTTEGFGLPLVEALQMGLPVLASDIPVFHEIGGDYPLYFSLDNPNSLIQAIEILQRDYAAIRKKIESFRWLSWDEAAETFFCKVVELSSLPGTNRKIPEDLQRTFEQNS